MTSKEEKDPGGWPTLVILDPGGLRQEDQEFQASLNYSLKKKRRKESNGEVEWKGPQATIALLTLQQSFISVTSPLSWQLQPQIHQYPLSRGRHLDELALVGRGSGLQAGDHLDCFFLRIFRHLRV